VTESSSPFQPRTLCLLRLSALGDACNTVPLVRALQRAWPQVKITWIIGRVEHELVAGLPDVEFIVFDKHTSLGGFAELKRNLKDRVFDALLLPQTSQRAAIAAAMVRARRRIGYDRQRARPGHGLVTNERIPAVPFQHQALSFMEFARQLGAETDGVDRRLPVPAQARAYARRHQPESGRAVLISPASSHPQRNWHAAGYAAVADWVIERAGRDVILMGGPSESERELGKAIESAMRHRAINLIGQDTLKQALAMFERAACVVSPDSGPAHFADAMGTPVVGLYAATWARRSGPLNSLEHCVDRYPEAARRFAGKPAEALRWGNRLELPGVMDLITPEMVIERLKPLLVD